MEKREITQVVAALIWDRDKFMICQRPAHKARGLLWEFVGGKVEPGETKPEALIRECREELAVELTVGEVFMEVLHEYPDITVALTLFHATIAAGVPKKIEHNDIQWITPAQIGDYDFCPADTEILEKIVAEYGCSVKRADITQLDTLTLLALALWPRHSYEEMAEELAAVMTSGEAAFFLAWAGDRAVGFAQCQLRHDYVEGTDCSPVGYLEGIFVAEDHRGRGIARQLLRACESWAKEQGCRQFASDCQLDNAQSLDFHRKVGFAEANRIICFVKSL